MCEAKITSPLMGSLVPPYFPTIASAGETKLSNDDDDNDDWSHLLIAAEGETRRRRWLKAACGKNTIHFRCNDQGDDDLGNHDDDAWAV